MGQGQVGVGGFGDLQGAAIEHEPGPAAAELGGTSGFELLDEGFEATEIGVDFVGQGACGAVATTGLHALPVETVVPHLGGVVEHTSFAGITGHRLNGLLEALAFEIRARHQVVEVGHVASVVLAVVKLQGGAGDMGLERIKAVGQRGQRMSHGFGRMRCAEAASYRGFFRCSPAWRVG